MTKKEVLTWYSEMELDIVLDFEKSHEKIAQSKMEGTKMETIKIENANMEKNISQKSITDSFCRSYSDSPSASVSPTSSVLPTDPVSPSASVSPHSASVLHSDTVPPTDLFNTSHSDLPANTSPLGSVSPTNSDSPSASVSPTSSVLPTDPVSPSASVSPHSASVLHSDTVPPTDLFNTSPSDLPANTSPSDPTSDLPDTSSPTGLRSESSAGGSPLFGEHFVSRLESDSKNYTNSQFHDSSYDKNTDLSDSQSQLDSNVSITSSSASSSRSGSTTCSYEPHIGLSSSSVSSSRSSSLMSSKISSKNKARSESIKSEPIINKADLASRILSDKATNLSELKNFVLNFDGCDLKIDSKNTVFSDGTSNAKIMAIGEAPGAEEDLKGIPFCGQSGKLLDKMFASIGLYREKNLYITNTIFWRPPNNRRPTKAEIDICKPFLEKHIALIKPELIIMVGATAVESLLGRVEPITKIRQKYFKYKNIYLENYIDTTPIFHPAYLLRQQSQKALAWEDLKLIKEKYEKIYNL